MKSINASRSLIAGLFAIGLAVARPSAAQTPIGTFTWQLQPYCNVLVVTSTPVGSGFRLEGYDDQCGAARRAPLTGTAARNPDGTFAFAVLVITSDGIGTPTSGVLSPGTFSGTWVDSEGLAGTLLFGIRSPAAGSPRPVAQQPAVVGSVTRTDSIQVFGAEGEKNILSLPFNVPPGRRADIVAFFNGQLRHASTTPVGSCFNKMRLDDAVAGVSLAPTADTALMLDGGVQVAFGAVHATSASLQAVGTNIAPGPHVLHVNAQTGGQGCFFGQRSLVVMATFR